MAIQTIDTTTDHGTYRGDPAKTAFDKINANTKELYAASYPAGAAEQQAQRARLGLGSAATSSVQQDLLDPNSGRLLSVGSFGLGRYLDLRGTIYSTGTPASLESGKATGYVCGFADLGEIGLSVSGEAYCALEVLCPLAGASSNGGVARTYTRFATVNGVRYTQGGNSNATSWGSWKKLLDETSIEYGTTSSGVYARYPNGVQECWYKSRIIRTISNQSGSVFFAAQEPEIAFPSQFVGAPDIQITASLENGEGWFAAASSLLQSTTSWPKGYVFSQIARPAQILCIDYYAIGRYK